MRNQPPNRGYDFSYSCCLQISRPVLDEVIVVYCNMVVFTCKVGTGDGVYYVDSTL